MTNIDKSVRYSALVDTKARDAIVLKDGVIFNTRYQGNPKAGSVKVRKPGAATVVDYNASTGAALSTATSEWITIAIDKDKAVNEKIDGYDSVAIPDGVIADALDSAAYGIANVLDTDGAAELVSGGTISTNTNTLTKSTIYENIVDANTTLSKAGVPNDNRRWLLVTPDTYALILKSAEFIKASDLGDSVVQNGAIGKISGFLVYECNHLGTHSVTSGETTTVYDVEYIAGHPDYAARVAEWAVPVTLNKLSNQFIGESAVQGRKVYGHKVTNDDCIIVKTKTHS